MLTAMETPQNQTYMTDLNPEQQKAVEATEGPVLVLAGAGTGKTRVLTTRLGHLLATHKANPGEILSVTFTNKAATEMKERVSHMLGGRPVEGWWLGTFHSIAARMLRQHADLVGLKQNFTILDTDDQIRLLKQILAVEGVDVKKWPPRVLLSFISRWKDKALTPDKISLNDVTGIADGKLQKIYTAYQERLRTLNACDFGDLLLHIITIFRNPEHRQVLENWQMRFKYILVDEYQDTNTGQYLWLRLLAQKNKNICCVGDDDQSIYGWRGAEIENILRFEKDFPEAKTIRLEQNYRSTETILSAANALIAHNTGRLGKDLWSAQKGGRKIQLHGVWDGRQEAQLISDEIEQLHREKHKLNEMAVLVRAGFQTREFEERFMNAGIPYRIIGGARFYERLEIRDALAYLRVLVQPSDDLAFERIVNTPKRGIGATSVNNIHDYARQHNIPLTEAVMRLLSTDQFKPRLFNALNNVMLNFKRWREQMRELSHTEIVQIILDESGYADMWQQDKSPEAPGRLENLKELVNAIGEFEDIPSFLEHVSLVMENQNKRDGDMVTVMTLHSAKGLEFETVFLPGWEEGTFPNQRTMDESGNAGLEEERRLAYVGITRAKQQAYIYHAANRYIFGNWISAIPARFIEEIPDEYLEKHSNVIDKASQFSSGSTYNHNPAQIRGRSAPMTTTASRIESAEGFNVGNRISHQKFGKGTVLSVEGDKLDIRFDKAGRKRLVDRFVTLDEA